jgi:hypothetical protein
MGVDLMSLGAYEPRWPGVVELNLADQWRARWVDEQELPGNAPVFWAYAMVCMGDYGYATREKGAAKWEMIEGPIGEATPEAFVKSAAMERTGATAGKVELIGFFECKATRHNTEFGQGAITVRPFYLVVAKKVSDLPASSNYERRRMRMAEYLVALRARYPELEDYVGKCASRYAVLRARGEA